jgi:hypothetical protein
LTVRGLVGVPEALHEGLAGGHGCAL